MQGGGHGGGGGGDHNDGSDASSPNDDYDGAEEEEAPIDIVKDKGEDIAMGSTSICWVDAATMMDAPPPLHVRCPLPLRVSPLQQDDITSGAKNAAASAGYHCSQSWHHCSRHSQQWRRDKYHGRCCLLAELHQYRQGQQQRQQQSMSMTPICLSSLDNNVLARQLSVVLNPLESSLQHPCCWNLGGGQSEAADYANGNNNNRRRT
jgi:hypothetical protein